MSGESRKIVVAIDGPAAAGKSSVAKLLAKRLRLRYLDTGAMYRALTLKALQEGVDLEDERALRRLLDSMKIELTLDGRVIVDGADWTRAIRAPEVTEKTFYAARSPLVREKMVELQRGFGKGGVVAEGRDMTTVVFPDADRKFFLDASLEVRARRRQKQLRESGEELPLEKIMADIRDRDEKDMTRDVAPLRRADDAIYLDTSNMTLDEVVDFLLKHIGGNDDCPQRQWFNGLIQRLWYDLCQIVCQVGLITLCAIRVYGKENIPDEGGAIIASNHQSFLDPVLIGVGLRRQIHYMARDSLFRNPLFRWLIESLNAFPVGRGKADVRAMREAIRLLREGNVVLLFPEGTRTWDGEIAELRKGVGLISRRANVPIVPAVIDGAFEAWPRFRKYPKPCKIKVAFGKPIEPHEQEKLNEAELASLIRKRMLILQDFLKQSGRSEEN